MCMDISIHMHGYTHMHPKKKMGFTNICTYMYMSICISWCLYLCYIGCICVCASIFYLFVVPVFLGYLVFLI